VCMCVYVCVYVCVCMCVLCVCMCVCLCVCVSECRIPLQGRLAECKLLCQGRRALRASSWTPPLFPLHLSRWLSFPLVRYREVLFDIKALVTWCKRGLPNLAL